MKYAIKNLVNFIRQDRLIFILTMLCVLISSIVSCFSYELYNNYSQQRLSSYGENTQIDITFNYYDNSDYITKKDLENCLAQFSDGLVENVKSYIVYAIDEDLKLECYFKYDGKEYTFSDEIRNNFISNKIVTVCFTDDQMRNGERVALCWDYIHDGREEYNIFSRMPDESTVIIQGKVYEIIGYQTWCDDNVMIPYSTLDDNTILSKEGLHLSLNKVITRKQYEEIDNIMVENFGDRVNVPDMTIPNGDGELYSVVILISVLISVITMLNFAILYKYILMKRKKSICIYMMCGMNRYKSIQIFLLECMMIVIPAFILGIVSYNYLVSPYMIGHFKYIENDYNFTMYLIELVIYIFVSLIILGILLMNEIVDKTIIDIKREGNI